MSHFLVGAPPACCIIPRVNRRHFLGLTLDTLLAASATGLFFRTGAAFAAAETQPGPFIDSATARDWLARWEKNILKESGSRYCDKEMGEELGWLVSPFLSGFYYGYLATRDPKWIDLLVDWTGSVLKRAIKEPDGYLGWPKGDGSGNNSTEFSADSLLGEAMLFTPVVLLAAEILKTPALVPQYGDTAHHYLDLAAQCFYKWNSRDCWREVKDGGVWVVPAFGVDRKSPEKWSAGYAQRKTAGFTNPTNKQNSIASWLLALSDTTGDPLPRARAEAPVAAHAHPHDDA